MISGLLLGFLYQPHQFFSSAGGRASVGPRASFRFCARASKGPRGSLRLSSFATQSPAHSLVPPTVPSGLQPTGTFGLSCTGSSSPIGASCANAFAENSSTAIIRIDFISVPLCNEDGLIRNSNNMLQIPFQPCIPAREPRSCRAGRTPRDQT
jgi:hypothetical protein